MKTDDLIRMLARAETPQAPARWRLRLAGTLLIGLAAAAALVAIGLGVRPDIGAARMPVMMKALFAAAATAAFLPLAIRLMRPGRPLGWRLGAVVVFAALAALACWISLMGADPAERMVKLMGPNGTPWCLVLIPLLAAPAAAALLWFMRAFAPTRLALAGAAIGAISGGVGAMAYAMYCPTDSVAFVTTWYSLAIALCAAIGAGVGSRLLRW
ncbi:MAG: DUF1109 domain-containing protein [Hyphomonadaceae bacterium]|nr:DUF1109 domain-containing protein [Hyphomonadaceae bacterium]